MQSLRNATHYEYLTTETIYNLLEDLAYTTYDIRENNSIVFKGKFVLNPYKTNYEFKIVIAEDGEQSKVTCFQVIDTDLDIVIIDIDVLKFANPAEYIEDFNIQNNQLDSLKNLIDRLKSDDIEITVTGDWI